MLKLLITLTAGLLFSTNSIGNNNKGYSELKNLKNFSFSSDNKITFELNPYTFEANPDDESDEDDDYDYDESADDIGGYEGLLGFSDAQLLLITILIAIVIGGICTIILYVFSEKKETEENVSPAPVVPAPIPEQVVPAPIPEQVVVQPIPEQKPPLPPPIGKPPLPIPNLELLPGIIPTIEEAINPNIEILSDLDSASHSNNESSDSLDLASDLKDLLNQILNFPFFFLKWFTAGTILNEILIYFNIKKKLYTCFNIYVGNNPTSDNKDNLSSDLESSSTFTGEYPDDFTSNALTQNILVKPLTQHTLEVLTQNNLEVLTQHMSEDPTGILPLTFELINEITKGLENVKDQYMVMFYNATSSGIWFAMCSGIVVPFLLTSLIYDVILNTAPLKNNLKRLTNRITVSLIVDIACIQLKLRDLGTFSFIENFFPEYHQFKLVILTEDQKDLLIGMRMADGDCVDTILHANIMLKLFWILISYCNCRQRANTIKDNCRQIANTIKDNCRQIANTIKGILIKEDDEDTSSATVISLVQLTTLSGSTSPLLAPSLNPTIPPLVNSPLTSPSLNAAMPPSLNSPLAAPSLNTPTPPLVNSPLTSPSLNPTIPPLIANPPCDTTIVLPATAIASLTVQPTDVVDDLKTIDIVDEPKTTDTIDEPKTTDSVDDLKDKTVFETTLQSAIALPIKEPLTDKDDLTEEEDKTHDMLDSKKKEPILKSILE